jgi:hypothetical protein
MPAPDIRDARPVPRITRSTPNSAPFPLFLMLFSSLLSYLAGRTSPVPEDMIGSYLGAFGLAMGRI